MAKRRNERKKVKKLPEGFLAHRFKPGQSGNPAGRPKSITLSEAYRHKLEELVPGDKEGRNWAEFIADRMVRQAAHRVSAAQELADRVEGKPAQFLQLRDQREKDEAPKQFVVQFFDAGGTANPKLEPPQPVA